MVDKLVTLQLGGQERTLLYGTMGYFSHIKDATGKEPFDWLKEFDEMRAKSATENIVVLTDDVSVIVYAGLNSFLDSKDLPNIPLEKVRKWCNGVKAEDFGNILASAFGTIQSDEPGELIPQPEQSNGQAKVTA